VVPAPAIVGPARPGGSGAPLEAGVPPPMRPLLLMWLLIP